MAYVSETLYGLDAKVDTADNVQVAYISTGSTDTSLYYMFRNYLGEWSDESIIDGYQPADGLNETDVGYFVEMAIDSSNKPVVAYYNAERGLPYLFDFTDQIIDFVTDLGGVYLPLDVWTGLEIGNAYSGTYISLAQDSSNTTHVAYFNNNPTPVIGSIESQYNRIRPSSQNTVGLVQDPISFLTGNACWPVSPSPIRIYNSLAINGNQVCIAYKGYNDGNLYYGCKSTSSGCEGCI